MTWFLIEIAIRFLVFGGVFWFAARRSDKIRIHPRYALPLVALVFGALNVGLYWLLAPVVNLATFGTMWIAVPFVINGALLYATSRVLRPLEIRGVLTMMWLAGLLTLAHGALYLGLDVLAPRWM
jgi:hypothetical protein